MLLQRMRGREISVNPLDGRPRCQLRFQSVLEGQVVDELPRFGEVDRVLFSDPAEDGSEDIALGNIGGPGCQGFLDLYELSFVLFGGNDNPIWGTILDLEGALLDASLHKPSPESNVVESVRIDVGEITRNRVIGQLLWVQSHDYIGKPDRTRRTLTPSPGPIRVHVLRVGNQRLLRVVPWLIQANLLHCWEALRFRHIHRREPLTTLGHAGDGGRAAGPNPERVADRSSIVEAIEVLDVDRVARSHLRAQGDRDGGALDPRVRDIQTVDSGDIHRHRVVEVVGLESLFSVAELGHEPVVDENGTNPQPTVDPGA